MPSIIIKKNMQEEGFKLRNKKVIILLLSSIYRNGKILG